ncbi:MAG TPA: hypothetical protein V6D18_10680 [Thermosynechococcaceae cyanobacterium]
MNHDSEALQRILLELIQVLLPEISLADLKASRPELETAIDPPGTGATAIDALPLSAPPRQTDSGPPQNLSFVDFGVPAVQDRYHALLKRRLQSEIQRKPPLFPWETEVLDYETDPVELLNSGLGSPTVPPQKLPVGLWPQLKALKLPIPLPETVLAQLFQQCQETVNASLREGTKLVRSVEALFPEQSTVLNQLAGLVVVSPARSSTTLPTTDPNFPASYETAAPAQQMLLALMAARELLEALTFVVTPGQRGSDRQWLTEQGTLKLQVQWDSNKLQIRASLPSGGSLKLRNSEQQASVDRSDAGILSVELPTRSQQSHTLKVTLADADTLTFAVRVED